MTTVIELVRHTHSETARIYDVASETLRQFSKLDLSQSDPRSVRRIQNAVRLALRECVGNIQTIRLNLELVVEAMESDVEWDSE